MDEWSGQSYYSPVFLESSCSADVCINAKNLGTTACGAEVPFYDTGTHLLYHADVFLNTQKGYADGPATSPSCDARSAYHHEIGHAFSEGHSAVSTDLMYTAQNRQEHVDADA